MGLFRPFPFGAGSIQAVPPNILAAFGGNMLCKFQEESHHRKGLGLSLEELVDRPFSSQGRAEGIADLPH